MLAALRDSNDSLSANTNKQNVFRRKSQAAAESIEPGDFLNATLGINPVDLAGFTSGPEIAFFVKSATLRMVKKVRENLERLGWNFSKHGVKISRFYKRPQYAGKNVSRRMNGLG